MIHAGHEVRVNAKTAKAAKDVEANLALTAQELEARTERLASCLTMTGDLEGLKQRTDSLAHATHNQQTY